MAETQAGGFDLDRVIAGRLDDATDPDTDTLLQALAVLVDADLTDTERVEAFGAVMATLLARLSTEEREHFGRIAEQDGEAAAMSYLSAVTRAMNENGRG